MSGPKTTKVPRLKPKQFRQLLKEYGTSQRAFAKLIQADVTTVNSWATGRRPIPYWTRVLLNLLIINRHGERNG